MLVPCPPHIGAFVPNILPRTHGNLMEAGSRLEGAPMDSGVGLCRVARTCGYRGLGATIGAVFRNGLRLAGVSGVRSHNVFELRSGRGWEV